MSDTAFYVFISAVCLQILVMVSFYFTTYQRLFFTPGTGNVLPFVLFLLFFKIAYPITFVIGWIRCRSLGLVRVMTFWTLAMVVMIGGIVMSETLRSNSDVQQLIQTVVFAFLTLCLGVFGLSKAFRIDGRLRSVLREPTDKNLTRVAEIGPPIIPHLKRLLDCSYAPTRLTAVKCLRRCGPEATHLLRVAATDEDPNVSREAGDGLAEIQPELALA